MRGRRRWAISAVVATVLATGITVAAVGAPSSSGPGVAADQRGVAQQATVPARYRALAARSNPLSAAMHVDCGGVAVPVPQLAAPGGAENGTSAASDALRHFLRHNPFAGMGSVTGKNWLLLSHAPNTLVFGQREGRIGVGTVVTLTRHGSSFTASGEGGCGSVVAARGRSGEPVEATVHGAQLVLHWTTGSNCGTGPAKTDRTLDRVLLKQEAKVVHVLLISRPSPDAGPLPPGEECAGVGLESTTRVRLDAPLGGRTLISDAHVPGERVQLGR